MTEPREYYEIVFLPWAPLDWEALGGELRIGKVIFHPYHPETIEDEKMRRFLNIYFARYRDIYNHPVQAITVCHYDPEHRSLLEPLPEGALREIVGAIDILLFCVIWDYLRQLIGRNWSFTTANSEIFEWYLQRFRRDSLDDEEPMIGLMTHRRNLIESVESLHFQMPLPAYRTPGETIRPDSDLLWLLNQIFTEQIAPDLRERILRSLKWFRLANKQAQLPDMETQVVQIATAFETLLALSQGWAKTSPFVKEVERWIRTVAGDKVCEDTCDRKGKTIATTKAGCWAADFYRLRSAIVHGDSFTDGQLFYALPDATDYRGKPLELPQHDVASFVYGAMLVQLIESATQFVRPDTAELTDIEKELLYKQRAWGVKECLERLGWAEPFRLPSEATTELARKLREQWVLFGEEAEQALSSQQLIEERARKRPRLAKEGHHKE